MFYWRSDENALYVAAQQDEIQHSFAIPPYALKHTTLEILCQRSYLFESLQKRMKWKPGLLYKTYGNFDRGAGMVCFPLENTQIMEGFES
jgi:hypothetical protein